MEDLEFILGYIAGEGSFFITFVKDDRVSRGFTCVPRLKVDIGMKDKSMLEEVSSHFGRGNIVEREWGHSWSIGGEDACFDVIERIDEAVENGSLFKHSAKYQSYTTWKECVEEIYRTDTDWVKVARRSTEINKGVGQGRTEDELVELVR